MYFGLYLPLIEKTPLGRKSSTLPHGYGMYYRLSISLIENSARESFKYSYTRMWNVFQAAIVSCWEKLLGGLGVW